MPTVTLVRHGSTDFNGSGRLRGWMDPPLNAVGRQEVAALKVPRGTLYCSDLLRAQQTAGILGECVWRVSALRPWNVGIFAGQPHSKVGERLNWLTRNPTVPCPFGETYKQFADRFLDFVRGLKEDSVLVTHFRNVKLLLAWDGGNGWDTEKLLDGDLLTGCVHSRSI